MSAPVETPLTYEDLARIPDDDLRREIIDGELFVTPAPAIRHQRAVVRILRALAEYADGHGGEVLPAPTDVYFTERDVVEPDVLFIRRDNAERVEDRFIRGAPDLVVEVSSPSTRRVDLVRKRALYGANGVPEYWFVDLEADRVEVYVNGPEGYGPPTIYTSGQDVRSEVLAGLSVPVDDVVVVET